MAIEITNWNGRIIVAAAVFACLPTVGLYVGGSYAALVIGLAAILLVGEGLSRRWPDWDSTMVVLAFLFLILLWLGLAWSIMPAITLSGDLQMTGLFVAGLVLLGLHRAISPGASAILRVIAIAAVIGPVILLIDLAAGHPLLSSITGRAAGDNVYYAKLSRGFGQFAVLIWPILAFTWRTSRRWQAALITILFAALLVDQGENNVAITVFFPIGLLVAFAATAVPKLVVRGLGACVIVAALGTPFIVHEIGRRFMASAETVKLSFRHRLEIWDFMTAHAFERPLSGWGWQASRFLHVTAEEQGHYKYLVAEHIPPHPHDFWIQLWVETGVLGVILGLTFTLIVLWRISRQPQDIRPFGLGAFATAFGLSLPSYNLGTDSWWCALAATAFLFALLPSARQRITQ